MYRIFYRDGLVGEARSWERTLFYVWLARNLPWPLRPVRVVEAL